MSQAELPRDLTAQPADEVTEKYWQLIRQNRAFLSCANRRDKIWEGNCSGCDRDRADGKKGRGSVGRANLPRLPRRWSVANGALVLH